MLSPMQVLKVEGLKKGFRRNFYNAYQQILNGITFNLGEGEIVGFLGANGAGKTTTIKCIMELIFADSGEVRFFGGQKLSSAVKAKIGFLPENPYFYDYLTGKEFLNFYCRLSKFEEGQVDINQRIDRYLTKVDLAFAKDRPLRSYSKGMLQKIGLVQAVIHRPKLLILDEPMSGLDPDGRAMVTELIRECAAEGATVFFSSHLLHDVETLCRRLIVVKSGQVLYEGETLGFISNVKNRYLLSFSTQQGIEQVTAESLEEAQKQIEAYRQKNQPLVEMLPIRQNLEQAFIEKAMRGKKT